jgi:hypothetical protein
MPSNPLTTEEILEYLPTQVYPARRIVSTHPSNSSAFAYYDIDSFGFGSASIDAVNLELKLTATLNRFKEFIYDGSGNLITMRIWDSISKAVEYFNISFNYTGDNLTNIQTIRISDSYTYDKDFVYDGSNNLVSIEIT